MKYIVAFVIVLSVAFTYKTDYKNLLCDKEWSTKYVNKNGSRIPIPPGYTPPTVLFNSNGVFENSMDGKREKGKWKYDEKTKNLTTIEKGSVTTVLKVIKLTKDTLELRGPDKLVVGFVPVRLTRK